ncbi:MAG: hypothetical protein AB1671_27125 [Thermodesulfobacteriota bacterium]
MPKHIVNNSGEKRRKTMQQTPVFFRDCPVHPSAEALLVILNDILDFSKIEAGGMALEGVMHFGGGGDKICKARQATASKASEGYRRDVSEEE